MQVDLEAVMAAAAETIMEARIARMESDIGHLREDVADIKQDVRALRGRVDVVEQRLADKIEVGDLRLDGKIDALAQRMDDRFGETNRRIDVLKDSFHSTRIWALALYIALAGAMLGTMARGFGWL
jgi:predicted RNase H-like nuclease (RuvC/YqgF family)